MKLPLIRVGITLAFGSIVASLVRFYVAMGARAADLDEPMPDTGRGIRDWFVKDFLFQGSVPEILFWTGIGVAVVGMGVMAMSPGKRRKRMHEI